jgi:threonine dehydrogenase-like Zn-dependent dehydrogenase
VEAVGAGVDQGLIGMRCVAENVLSDGGEIGFEHPGGYGEFFLTAARNLYTLPPGFPYHIAALVEPLSVTVRGLRRLRPEAGQRVLIFGDGPIGLLTLMLSAAGRNAWPWPRTWAPGLPSCTRQPVKIYLAR